MSSSTTGNSTVQAREGENEKSCRSCLYTGVGTCIGLSAYFFHLAFEVEASNHGNGSNTSSHHNIKQSTTQPSLREKNVLPSDHKPKISSTGRRIITAQSTSMKLLQKKPFLTQSNRPFLLFCSACWATAGAYRLYLN